MCTENWTKARPTGAYGTTATEGGLILGYFAKKGGTFPLDTAEGPWYGHMTSIDLSTPAVFWIWGKITVRPTGNMRGTFDTPTGDTFSSPGGTLTTDSDGVLGGSSSLATGGTMTIVQGKQDPSHTKDFLVTSVTDPVMGNA